jgi:hypothetical protein
MDFKMINGSGGGWLGEPSSLSLPFDHLSVWIVWRVRDAKLPHVLIFQMDFAVQGVPPLRGRYYLERHRRAA